MARVKQTARMNKTPTMNKETSDEQRKHMEEINKRNLESIQNVKTGLQMIKENPDAFDKEFIMQMVGDICNVCTSILSENLKEAIPLQCEVVKGTRLRSYVNT